MVRLAREVRELAAQVAQRAPAESSAAAAPVTPEVKPEEKALPEIDFSVDFYEAEVRSELAQLNKQIFKLEANKKELANKVATYSRRMNMPPTVMQELASLTQDHESAKQRYTYLSTRKLNSDLAGKVDTDANNKTFTTVDPPNLPQAPVRPDRVTLTGVGCIAGLMLGIGLAFARDILDPTLSDENSAVSELKMPVLTSIPFVGSTKSDELKQAKKRKKEAFNLRLLPQEQPADEPAAAFSIQASETNIRDVISGRSTIATEQFQMMRAELSALRQRGLKSLVITSAVPDEGKTFVACCLAGMLAKEQDRKVLLIDGDLRTGSAGHALKFDNGVRRNGLSDVLSANGDVENFLIPCLDSNLWVLPAGRAIDNPVELLSSPRLQQMMKDLTVLFDWIIVDSPPVLPIADTSVLSPICDASLIVVRADRTPASLIKKTIDKVGRGRVPGIVLNGVREIHAKQYYGHYYHQLTRAQK
jgi:capsular exopolysaccharide synthesis family protein